MLLERNPGGAPANVAAAVAKLGRQASFLGKVGDDEFGRFLKETLEQQAVDTAGLIVTDEYPTTLAFVHLNDEGDRSFSFYRKHSADQMLRFEEIELRRLAQTAVFHFGSVSMTSNPAAEATIRAAEYAKEHGALISYDPNLRPPLWRSLDEARAAIIQALRLADLVKISEEEVEFLTGTSDMEEGSRRIAEEYGTQVICVTLGPEGCLVRRGEQIIAVPGFTVKAIDTTGAGDSFMGSMLYQILESGLRVNELTGEQLGEFARFANAAGALTTLKRGGITALPELPEVLALLQGSR